MRTCRRAFRYFRPDWPLISVLVVLVAVSFAISVAQAWPIPMMLDLVFSPVERTDWVHKAFIAILPATGIGRIFAIAGLGLGLKVAADTTWFLGRTMLNNKIKYRGLARIREDLYNKLQQLSLEFHRGRPQGDTLYRVTTDTQAFFGILDTFIGAAVACVTVMVMSYIMWEVNAPLTGLALAIVPLLVVTNLAFARVIKRRADVAKQGESDFTTTTQRSLGAMGLIQAFWRQRSDMHVFDASVRQTNAKNWKLDWSQALYPLAVQGIFAAGAAIIFGYGGYLAYRDQFVHPIANGVTIGELIAFMYYVAQLNDPLARLTGFRAAIQTNVASANRVLVVLDMPVTVNDRPDAIHLPVKPRTLTLQNISFAYPHAMSPTLKGIQATIRSGQFVAFVGPSGAGKSTLLSLLPRFYDVLDDGGAVRLDGQDIRRVRLADVRRHIATVQQDSPMMAGTIAENIAFGRPQAAADEIVHAAQMAGAANFIEGMPGGYEAMISEGGQNLSGGQRQRLALARALLAETPILVLDEPTSGQDPANAAQMMATVESLRGSRTIILVTHDLELVEGADQIYVLRHGRLAEHGTHRVLLAKNGVYAALRAGEAIGDVETKLTIAG